MSKRKPTAPVSLSVDFYRCFMDVVRLNADSGQYVDWSRDKHAIWDRRIRALNRAVLSHAHMKGI